MALITHQGQESGVALGSHVAKPVGYRALQSLTVVASNIAAVEAGIQFLRGGAPFVVLHGPSGWGKTQLVQGLEAEGLEQGLRIRVRDAAAWVKLPSRSDHNCALILEDVQGLARHPRLRHSMGQLLARRVRARRPTLLVTTTEFCPAINRMLPHAAPSWKFVAIEQPSDREKVVIVRALASGLGLELADEVSTLIARHLRGNGRSVIGALERLKLAKQSWSQPEDVLPACGVLRAYWLEEGCWDARDTVAEAVAQTCGACACEESMRKTIAYFLLDELGLTEHESASFLRVTEAMVYRWAAEVRKGMGSKSERCPLEACRIAIISALKAS